MIYSGDLKEARVAMRELEALPCSLLTPSPSCLQLTQAVQRPPGNEAKTLRRGRETSDVQAIMDNDGHSYGIQK